MKRERKSVMKLASVVIAFCVALVLLSKTAAAASTISINDKNFPDETFREWVSENADKNGDGSLSPAEQTAVKSIDIESSPIQSLKGIEYFTSLQDLYVQGELSGRLDLSKNKLLETVDVAYNYEVTSIDVSTCSQLRQLNVNFCSIRSLDVSKNLNLTSLRCGTNCLQSLNVSKNTLLTMLECNDNKIKTLDVSKLTDLTYLYCSGNPLTTLNLKLNTQLLQVDCSQCALTSLDLGYHLSNLQELDCSRNDLISLNCGGCSSLCNLRVHGNRLTSKSLTLGGFTVKLYNEYACSYETADDYHYGLGLPVVRYDGNTRYEVLILDQSVAVGKEISVKFYYGLASYDAAPYYSTKQISGTQFAIPKVSVNNYLYYFLGWSLAPNATVAQFKTGDKITLYRNTILYPVFKDKTYKITFDLNGGTSGAPAAITGIPYERDYIEIPSSSPVREGYYFMGWSETKKDPDWIYKSGDAYYSYSKRDTVLYAVWTPRTNKISFDANGGSGTVPATISVLTGKEATIPKSSLTRSGYWFLGWSTNKNATSATYKSNSKISVTKDTVLYAVWKSQTATTNCTLTFDANGGTNPPAKITATKGATVTIPSSSVTRTGYWFLGWATSKTATTAQYKSGNTLTLSANTTLYAVWKKK